jgi:hypothetical protein
MPASYQVTCIIPDGSDPDQRIDAIGGATGGQGGGPWQLLIDAAIVNIENGTYTFWTLVQGRRAEVIVAKRSNGRKYLKTTADGYEPNNLLSLPRCP